MIWGQSAAPKWCDESERVSDSSQTVSSGPKAVMMVSLNQQLDATWSCDLVRAPQQGTVYYRLSCGYICRDCLDCHNCYKKTYPKCGWNLGDCPDKKAWKKRPFAFSLLLLHSCDPVQPHYYRFLWYRNQLHHAFRCTQDHWLCRNMQTGMTETPSLMVWPAADFLASQI